MTVQPVAEPSEGGTLLTGERHVPELIATSASLSDTLDASCRLRGTTVRAQIPLPPDVP